MNNIIFCLVILIFSIKFLLSYEEINQVVFLNPQTNSTFIRCPLDYIPSLDIQWFDDIQQQYNLNRGRYYRIYGLQPFDRELICFSLITKNDKYKIKVRTYDRPLPIPYFIIKQITDTSLTIQWKDDIYNQNANITFYQLILKYNNIIQSRILVNKTFSTYKFSSLYPNTIYSIEISAIDIWNRSSLNKILITQTLLLNLTEKIFSNQIIDSYFFDQLINCYNFNSEYLLIEFNSSKYNQLNYIYNLTVYNTENNFIFTSNLHSSFIYYLNNKNFKYKIELIILTNQSKYLGQIFKNCQDFSSLICSIKLNKQNKYSLILNIQLYKYKKIFQPKKIFYQIKKNNFIQKNLENIHQFIIENITNINENYSIIIEHQFLNEKFNSSILCSIHRTISNNQISYIIIIGLVLLILSFIIFIFLIIYQRFTRDLSEKNHSITSIPLNQFSSYVLTMHENNNLGFKQLFDNISQSTKIKYNKSKIEDYPRINANYIDDYEKINAYIEIQGSIRNIMNEFWKMIWEKNVNVIVMITNIDESEIIKSDVIYWPEESTEFYENIEVTLIKMTSLAYYIHRIFSIRYNTNEKLINDERLIHQFEYIHWPNHGVPLYPLSILSFIHHSSSYNSETNGPIVVHSYNHTGTYIVIDIMLKLLNKSQSLDIPLFLKQRYNLVQTLEEFMFIYDVLFEAIQSLNLNSIEKQFQFILEYKNENELYLHGYFCINQFIILQHPIINNKIEFWQMIWNNQTNIIISLYTDENLSTNIYNYWPILNEIIDCENFHVYLIDEYFQYDYIYRNCLIRSTESDYELQVKIISCSYWPDTCSPIETSFNLINTIKQLNSQKPIVVHDQFGTYRAGTFCALYTMKEQIENEGIINVYELAKFYHIKRPGIWHNADDLLFLYDCAEILRHQSRHLE